MKKSKKSIAALLCVTVLLLLSLSTLVIAFLDIPGWEALFQACLAAIVGIPILLWIYIVLYEKWKEQRKKDM